MPVIKRTFNGGGMNRDLDDRLVPPGQYREALNVNIGKSESADMGAVENILGTELIGDINTANAKCIGVFRDNFTERIYFFTTTNNSFDKTNSGTHAIYEFSQVNNQLRTLVTRSDLNFHQDFPVNGINLVDNLLFWTDNRNCPRKINVEKARNDAAYYTNLTSLDDVASVAKFAPYNSPTVLSIGTTDEQGQSITSNFLENKMIRFSYRWKFEDGEYSLLAPFTTTMFSRLNNVDTISTNTGDFGEIETFINAIKAVQLQVPTPTGYGIVEAELIYKETGSTTLYVVESKPVTTTATLVNFFYESQDPFKTLPPDQLTRVYDAVPRVAKTQELAGGRIVYGNFLQNYNVPDISFNVSNTGEAAARNARIPYLSVKSRRTYQIGIVLADKFGRQTPVILSNSGGDSIYIDPEAGDANSTDAFNALRIAFSQTQIDALKALDWAYSYRVVIKQREQEYYNWISIVTAQNTVARLGDSINKIPRDQTAVIPPSTGNSISPCDVSVFPKYLNATNQTGSNSTIVQSIANPAGTALVSTGAVTSGLCIYETTPVETDLDIFYETPTSGLIDDLTTTAINIDFFNCYLLTISTGAHIEINRLRAGYNETAFDYGVRAYVVQENFAEELRFNTLIHSSGLFNSRTGINYINQFNESEGGLTVSLDPRNGSIQKLHANDTAINIFQEDKVSFSPINKDFIYSAEGGNIPVTSNTQFLGTIAPINGEYGISLNPESFAHYGIAQYFADKNNGVILRLAGNQIVEISQNGMSDFFRDALKSASSVVGCYDEYHAQYTLTLIGECYDSNDDTNVATASSNYLTLSFDESLSAWSTFKSYNPEKAISLNNTFYSFNTGNLWQHNSANVTRNSFYGENSQESYIVPIFNDDPSTIKTFNNIQYEGTSGWEIEYIETDISALGTVPTAATSYSTTLKFSGSGPNSVVSGESSICAKSNQVIQWIATFSPISSDYQFTATNDIILTPPAGVSIISPASITNGNLVFVITTNSGTANSTETVAISGVGAAFAYSVALLIVNIDDAVSNTDLAPASISRSTAGASTLTWVLTPGADYYIPDPVNPISSSTITVDISNMPAATNPQTPTAARNSGNQNLVDYSMDVTVPAVATSGEINLTGAATLKPILAWAGITGAGTTGAVFNLPTESPGLNQGYFWGPFDGTSGRTATVVWAAGGVSATETITNSSLDNVVFTPANTITKNVNADGAGADISVLLDVFTTNQTATGTINTSPIVAATLGVVAANQPPDFAWENNPTYSTATAGLWTTEPNVILDATVGTDTWIKIGKTSNPTDSTITDVDPEAPFFINVDDYGGSAPTPITRSGTIDITYGGSRITGLTSVTITIEQQRQP
jgi:hypothetical protein